MSPILIQQGYCEGVRRSCAIGNTSRSCDCNPIGDSFQTNRFIQFLVNPLYRTPLSGKWSQMSGLATLSGVSPQTCRMLFGDGTNHRITLTPLAPRPYSSDQATAGRPLAATTDGKSICSIRKRTQVPIPGQSYKLGSYSSLAYGLLPG